MIKIVKPKLKLSQNLKMSELKPNPLVMVPTPYPADEARENGVSQHSPDSLTN
jgi:hypothetical protein